MILINLLPEEYRRKETVKISLPELPSKTTIVRILAGFLIFQLLLTIFSLYQHFVAYPMLKKEVSALSEELKEVLIQKSQTMNINSRLRQMNEATERSFYWSSFLSTLSGSVTKGVWLTSFKIEKKNAQPSAAKAKSKKAPDKTKDASKKKADAAKAEVPVYGAILKLQGTVYAPGQETASVGRFIKELKSTQNFSMLFDEIELGNMSQRKIKEYDVYDFELICKFKRQIL